MKINIKIYLFFSEGRKSKEIKGNQRKGKEREFCGGGNFANIIVCESVNFMVFYIIFGSRK